MWPVAGQRFDTSLAVDYSKSPMMKFPVGTRFRFRAKLTGWVGGGAFHYSSCLWPVEVICIPKER